jgi:hypothetical protein
MVVAKPVQLTLNQISKEENVFKIHVDTMRSFLKMAHANSAVNRLDPRKMGTNVKPTNAKQALEF